MSGLLKFKIKTIIKQILFYFSVISGSFLTAYFYVKDDVKFIGLWMIISVIFCLNWPFFSIVLLVFLSIAQPGLFSETLDLFRPFFLISGASFFSWFLGFGSKKIGDFAWNIQSLFVIGLMTMETVGSVHAGWAGYIIETFMVWIKIFIIYFLVASLANSLPRIRFVMWSSILAVLVVALYALDIYFFSPEKMIAGRLASYGMYDNPNDLALIMVVCWPLIFKLIEIERSLFIATILTVILLIIMATLVLTASRGGLLGLMTVGFLSLISCTKLTKKQKYFILTAGMLMAVAAIPVVLAGRGEESGFDAEDESASHRLEAWQAGGRILLRYPEGIGFNQFIEYVGDYGGPNYLQAHNTPVKVSAESGWIGIFCYLAMIFTTIRQLIIMETKLIEYGYEKAPISVLAQSIRTALAGFLVNTSFSVKEHEWMLYIVLGLGVAIYNIFRTREKQNLY
ncbi:O-antigen ligase family protein, partial [candidate division KSB1 bacterium]|nr:O-antigen ligase family protein [candidate division KSB1 bacterium]